MNKAIKALLTTMLNQRIIGGKHTPEKNIINSKTKYLSKQEKKDFKKQYKQLKNNYVILSTKKRTKKSFDTHISLNPKSIKEVYQMLEEQT